MSYTTDFLKTMDKDLEIINRVNFDIYTIINHISSLDKDRWGEFELYNFISSISLSYVRDEVFIDLSGWSYNRKRLDASPITSNSSFNGRTLIVDEGKEWNRYIISTSDYPNCDHLKNKYIGSIFAIFEDSLDREILLYLFFCDECGMLEAYARSD